MYDCIRDSIVGLLQRTYNGGRDYATEFLRRGLFAVPETRSNWLTVYIWLPGFFVGQNITVELLTDLANIENIFRCYFSVTFCPVQCV